MPKRDAAKKRAREIQDTESIGYHDALNRARAELAETATEETPAPAPAVVVYVLEPTAAEVELGITAEELGIRALPANAAPGRRAHAEAVWRTELDPARPCRCSGVQCHHGKRCTEEYSTESGADVQCEGRLIHADRFPGSLWGITSWWDVYQCGECGEASEAAAELPDIPWGEHRPNPNGAEGFTTLIYDGARHPAFPVFDEAEDEGEFDPDDYPAPGDDYYGDEDQEDEEPFTEEDQEHEPDYLDDGPDGDDVDPPEEHDEQPGEDELDPPSEVPAARLRATAANWSPAFDFDNAPPSAC
ncbi:hypothetical protein QMK19_33775 [Streptomyces sp. H10-C2]|uniref:hypothetical protein n=1 Tax=unclassified Streptomyces TaxID=2593676 RepID=UPI0024BBD0E1|nr:MULTISPECIES: hypothetical protein [unclassified Streptomyces]MDJ0345517.1 hypothetical protein [Streptomyces sp. PH10-H1]MDJ0374463.1 hypothetical protein [Streptomyces sp. H10-C2]